jgi:hypothetical protein
LPPLLAEFDCGFRWIVAVPAGRDTEVACLDTDRGVFFKDLGSTNSVCRFNDNQLILVASLDDDAIAHALIYIIEHRLESQALEELPTPEPEPRAENSEDHTATEADQIEARINGWLRSAISLMRCADIATSRDEIIEQLVSRGRHIVKLIEDDESSA